MDELSPYLQKGKTLVFLGSSGVGKSSLMHLPVRKSWMSTAFVKTTAKDDCGSRSKFIENAIIFYCGYLSSNLNEIYLPNVITSTLKSSAEASEERLVRMIFKLAVELEMTMNVVAFTNNISSESLRKLRADCIDEVKKVNGSLSFEEAYDWQHS